MTQVAKAKAFDCVIHGHPDGDYVLTVGAATEQEARQVAKEHAAERYGENGKVGTVKRV